MAIEVRKNTHKETTYRARVRDPAGHWYPSPTFTLREAALEEEARLLRLKRKGARCFSDDARRVTESEYWEVWSIENRPNVTEGWKRTQDQMHRDYIEPVLGGLKMIEIGKPEIGRVLNRMIELGRGAQTRQHVYTLLRTMFGDAVEYYEMLATNPVSAKFHRTKVLKKKRDFLPPAQARLLLQAGREHYIGPAIWTQLLAGLRVEATLGLRWEDSVHWDLDQFLICRAWKKKVRRMEEYPKGKDHEYVPMLPRLKEYLNGVWEARGRPAKGFVCTGLDGQSMLDYQAYRKHLGRLCQKAGVPEMTTHELRHSCTEIWVEAGANAEDLRRLLNHANVATTMNYIHRTDSRLHALAERVEKGLVYPPMYPSGDKEAVEPKVEALH